MLDGRAVAVEDHHTSVLEHARVAIAVVVERRVSAVVVYVWVV